KFSDKNFTTEDTDKSTEPIELRVLGVLRGRTLASVKSRGRRAARFQLTEQAADLVFLLQRVKAPIHVVGHEFRFGLADGFTVLHLVSQPIEGGHVRSIAGGELSVIGFVEGPRAPMLRQQKIGLRV